MDSDDLPSSIAVRLAHLEQSTSQLIDLQKQQAAISEKIATLLEERQVMGRRVEVLESSYIAIEVRLGRMQERFNLIFALGGVVLTAVSSLLVWWIQGSR